MLKRALTAALFVGLASSPAAAQTLSDPTPAFVLDTMFVALCAIFVMWMAAGFTMLETGFVRAKNVANQCAKNLGLFSVASICFMLTGYSLLFPEGQWMISGIVGSVGLTDVGGVAQSADDVVGGSTARSSSVLYQMMFCAATASIVSGSLAERMRLLPFFIFTAVLTAIIYPIQASWTWGGGFLETRFGFQDLAGGTVVHVVGGVAALTGAFIVGARNGRFKDGMSMPMPGSNLPLATLGALILWMGWFGFTAGSYTGFSTEADAANMSRILLNTNLAAAGGVAAAALMSYVRYKSVDLTFMINGALAGLVAITAGPLFPDPVLAMSIGAVGGVIVVLSVPLLDMLKIDDVVGAIPVHLFAGVWGTLAVILSHPDATLFGQLGGLIVVALFVAVTTAVVWTVLRQTIGLRVSSESEENGIDMTEMGQEGYPEFAVQ